MGVGKSSLAIRFTQDIFSDYLESTLGAAYFETTHAYSNGKKINFQFWDTAGQEKYRSIARIYFKDCKIAIAVYDVTNKSSFLSLQGWINELQNNGPSTVLLAIVGNKIDLLENNLHEEVPLEEV